MTFASEAGVRLPGGTTERRVLLTVAFTSMLAPLNSTMIAVALPQIAREFQADIAAGWLITAYLIVMAAVQPVGGKLGDRFGRRTMIFGGLWFFALASAGATLATSLPVLFAFRLLQALSGAVALPNGAALIREVIPSSRRASRAGLVGAAIATAAAAGPPLGGLLADLGGWRAIFLANAPVIAVALVVGWRALPVQQRRPAPQRFDLFGSFLLSALLVGLAWLLSFGRSVDLALPLGGAALVSLAGLFLVRELHHPDPIVRPGLFRRRAFAAAGAAVGLSNLAMYSTLLAVPLLFAVDALLSSAEIGLVLTALSATSVLSGPAGGRLADRLGRRSAALIGLGIMSVGLVPIALTAGRLPTGSFVAALAVVGLGLGLSSASLQVSALEAVDAQEVGAAAGVFSTCRYVGSIVGSALLATLLGGGPDGFGALFMVVLGAGMLSVVVSLGLPDRPSPRAGEERTADERTLEPDALA